MCGKAALSVTALAAVAVAMSSVAKANVMLLNGNENPADSVEELSGLASTPVLLTVVGATGNTPATGAMVAPNMSGMPVWTATLPNSVQGYPSSNPTLADMGWESGPHVGLSFNANQSGGSGITMQSLTLTLFNPTTFAPVVGGSFSIAGPIDFSGAAVAMAGGGTGKGLFNFVLSPLEQMEFNDILANPTNGGFAMLVGLSTILGCPAGAPATCMPTNAGQEIFHGFDQDLITPLPPLPGPGEIPLPAALPLFATGLGALGLLGWRRKRKAEAAS